MNETSLVPKKFKVTIANTVEIYDLALRSPKFTNFVSFFSLSQPSHRKLKRIKLLRKIKFFNFFRGKFRIEETLLHHYKSLRQISLPTHLRLTKKILKYQIAIDEFKLYLSNPLSWKNFLTKLSIKILWLDDIFQENLSLPRKPLKVNISRATRHIARLRGLEHINVSIPDSIYKSSHKFFSSLDKEIASLPHSLTINLHIFSSSKENKGETANNFLVPHIAKRIRSITAQSGTFFPKFISEHIFSLSNLQSLKMLIEVSENTSLQYLQLFSYLNSLTSLQIDFYFRNSISGLKDFLNQFCAPKTLQALDLSFSYLQFPSIHQLDSKSKCVYESQDLKAPLQSFIKKIHGLTGLESLKLASYFDSNHQNISLVFPFLVSLLKGLKKLTVLHILFYSNKQADVQEDEEEEGGIDFQSMIPFRFGQVFGKCLNLFESLTELKIQFPCLSFEDFNLEELKAEKLLLKTIFFTGQFLFIDKLGDFFRLLEPEEKKGSKLTLKVLHVTSEDFSELLEVLADKVQIETLNLKISSEGMDKEIVLKKLLDLLSKIRGPKEILLEAPQLNLGYDDHILILEALEISTKELVTFKVYFGCSHHDKVSNFFFELKDDKYRLADFEIASEINSYSPISSFNSGGDEPIELDDNDDDGDDLNF